MAARPRPTPLWFTAWACGVTLACAAAFYLPGRAAAGGDWPVPLDDVYIHFDYARAWATGHPFEWIAGQGYASGETSPAYALVLALGYGLGFHGLALGVWAAFVACGSLISMMGSLHRLIPKDPVWIALLASGAPFACGTLDFTWFSGMEVALFGAVAAALLVACDGARAAGPASRARQQWRAGVIGGALVLVRPEAAVVVAVATCVVARRAGVFSPWAACARVALPGAIATVLVATLNLVFTGSAESAGALLKLLSSNPFATDEERARDYLVGLLSLLRTLRHDLGDHAGHLAYVFPALALASLASRRTRALGVLCLGSALAFALLVSWNGAARYQNFRDYMPAVALLLFASGLGASALARRARTLRAVAAFALVVATALGMSHLKEASTLFARAARNIHDQQVTVGRKLRRETATTAIVLVGDAGAIPYVSGRHAVDALGLGGYHGMPFVRAAVQGEAATLELIERLDPALRPNVMALYPNWFPGITSRFGRETGRVSITDNVICGGVTKVLYDADWASMRTNATREDERFDGSVLDEVDVADIVSEEEHAYLSPAPHGGWTRFDIRTAGDGARRFDAGRVVPEGEEESFVLWAGAAAGAEIVVRTDEVRAGDEASLEVDSRDHRAVVIPLRLVSNVSAVARGDRRERDERDHDPAPGLASEVGWARLSAVVPTRVEPGDRIRLRALHGELRDFHAWLVGGKP